jgi:hypothetical protein
VLPAA